MFTVAKERANKGQLVFLLTFILGFAPAIGHGEEGRSPIRKANQTAVSAFLDVVPRLNADDAELESFELTGRLPSPLSPTVPIRARVGWNRDSGTSLLLSTVEGGTPILWATQEKALICDFTSQRLTVVNDVYPVVVFKIQGGEVRYKYRLYTHRVPHVIDLPSFAANFGSSWKVDVDSEMTTLSATSRSGRSTMTMRFRDNPKPQFVGFLLRANDRQRTVLNSIDSIRINETLSPALTEFPEDLIAQDQLPVETRVIDDTKDAHAIGELIGQVLITQPLLENAQLRKRFAGDFPKSNVDWDNARSRYNEIAPKLRRIIKNLDGQ